MKHIDATPETIRAVTEAFKLASFLDDRIGHPDRYRIAAWSEQAQRHNLTESDLLHGVENFHDQSSDRAMQCGDLIDHARAVRRERLRVEREARIAADEATVNKVAADEIFSLAGDVTFGPPKQRTERLAAAEAALQVANTKEKAQSAICEYFAAKKAAS